MFDHVAQAPADPILGLLEAYRRDPNPNKIDLTAGIYQDDTGNTPILASVKQAEAILLAQQKTKQYLGIGGDTLYAELIKKLILGDDHALIKQNQVQTIQTPGGTGALRVAGELIKSLLPNATLWLSSPTWNNHPHIFSAINLPVAYYPYYDKNTQGLAFDAMLEALQQIPAGDVVLFHACCHNPCGIDPTPLQWQQIADVAQSRGFLPFFDFAYQGFGKGLTEDAYAIRLFLEKGIEELLIASSYSKNFSLYSERTGALTMIGRNSEEASRVVSQAKSLARSNYSNPPSHGAAIVSLILSTPDLKKHWLTEVDIMRERIAKMRVLLVQGLHEKGAPFSFEFINQQYGMFSYSGLNAEQVGTLREKNSIYMLDSGRMSLCGINRHNVERLCDAIVSVL